MRLVPHKNLSLDDIGDLKGWIISFALSPRFEAEFRRTARERFGPRGKSDDQAEWINFIDWFTLQRRTRAGRTPLEIFLEERTDLDAATRAQLARWKDVRESLFEIRAIVDPDTVRLFDLVGEQEYLVRATKRISAPGLKAGGYVWTRLVPWEDYWLYSGITRLYGHEIKGQIPEIICKLKTKNPSAVWKLLSAADKQKAFDAQAELHRAFVAHFGADEADFPNGRALAEAMTAFFRFYTFEYRRSDTGQTAAERAQALGQNIPPPPPFKLPPELRNAPVSVLFDPRHGIFILREYATFRRIFTEPDFETIPGYRELLENYLHADSISPIPFERMVARYPAQAEKVLQTISKKRHFRLKEDFPKMMRRYKPGWYGSEPVPSISVVKSV
jgi:hypothetical protein